ncbi:mitochondrial mRNA pseudouridine synthase RPUSD3 [Heteronotia binoei]|uniref:mitochondrial mRNA pseudouridine synthase RPUSD3 n=1 Tax=Heteronotia binoei TaxID=13085 RepID=UPI00292E1EB5|nr:mitochondrial mRNA pseudouridine synthase RPUSD3 [Heteronotia binoei]
MELSAYFRPVSMLRNVPWRFNCRRRSSRVALSTLTWYQMLLKEGDLGKPLADGSGGVSILGPARPLSRQALIKLLAASVVHKDGALVAISKPPGLPVTGKPDDDMTLVSLLPDLSQKLGLSQDVRLIKAPGKESSGLVLLSDCQSTIQHCQEFYARCRKARQPEATYCAVTTRVPADSEGEISTGLQLIHKEDSDLVVPVASPSRGSLQKKEVKNTKTCYKVLDSEDQCALVQLQPLTVFPCQLLVHLTLILSPALGDHMYSSRVGAVLEEPFLLPAETTPPRTQVLDEALLCKLNLKQPQVHRLPLHLHLHQLLLPAATSSASSTVLTAPPPPFFLQTLSLLGLCFPTKETRERHSEHLPRPGRNRTCSQKQ